MDKGRFHELQPSLSLLSRMIQACQHRRVKEWDRKGKDQQHDDAH